MCLINRNYTKKTFLLALTLIGLFLSSCSEKDPKPNVIFILTDQWRASALGYNGNEVVKTPHLDAFAKEAVNFRNAVSVNPVCTPYRASLLTGRYPTTTGMFLNDLYLPPEELTMAEIYQQAGYQTAYLGKWHLDGHGREKFVDPERRQGFEFWKGAECDHDYLHEHYYFNDDTTKRFWDGYSTYSIIDAAQDYLEQVIAEPEPFLLFVSLATPHFPHHTAPEEYKALYNSIDLNLPPNVPAAAREDALNELIGYYGHATATDQAIGDLLDKMKELGIFENSIIVFTSDHGEMMGSHGRPPRMKQQPHIEAANVPFLISYPDIGAKQGLTAQSAITTPDILPSLLALSGIPVPDMIEGYDLSGIMQDPAMDLDRAALYMNVFPFAISYPTDEYRAVKTSKHTYVKTPDGPSMLFDDQKDPHQMYNLIDDPQYADLRNTLDQKLRAELERIGETDIKPRFHYLSKFGYDKTERFRPDYGFGDYNEPAEVVSPKTLKP